jgi:hypothetical protein
MKTNKFNEEFFANVREMERLDYNRFIIDILSEFIEAKPDYRFCQLLQAIGINIMQEGIAYMKDNFYEESSITYKRIIKN